jgi:chromosome segregation ATPase
MNLHQAQQELHRCQTQVRDAENARGALSLRIATIEEKLEVCATSEDRRWLRAELEKAKDELADAAHAVTVAKQAEKAARERVAAAEAWPKQRRAEIAALRRQLRHCEGGQWAQEERVRCCSRDLAAAERDLADLLHERDHIAARLATLEAEEQTETSSQAAQLTK